MVLHNWIEHVVVRFSASPDETWGDAAGLDENGGCFTFVREDRRTIHYCFCKTDACNADVDVNNNVREEGGNNKVVPHHHSDSGTVRTVLPIMCADSEEENNLYIPDLVKQPPVRIFAVKQVGHTCRHALFLTVKLAGQYGRHRAAPSCNFELTSDGAFRLTDHHTLVHLGTRDYCVVR